MKTSRKPAKASPKPRKLGRDRAKKAAFIEKLKVPENLLVHDPKKPELWAKKIAKMVTLVKKFVRRHSEDMAHVAPSGEDYVKIAKSQAKILISARTARRLFASKKATVARFRQPRARRNRLKCTYEELARYVEIQGPSRRRYTG